ncbi:MAG: hypothetical protein Q9165_000409 [Trypethelium subeluteriae]
MTLYCWFCKEFWGNRVIASNLQPAETRIPDYPDQTEFLEKWYEFHQGYRIVKHEDGSQHRTAVLGEPFRDVSPGYLPRTIDELRTGRNPAQNPYVQASDNLGRQPENPEESNSHGNLEDALDQMLEQVEADEEQQGNSQRQRPRRSFIAARSQYSTRRVDTNTQYQTRRAAALRRELQRMRNGVERVISGLRELGEDVDSWQPDDLANLGRTLDDITPNVSSAQPTSSERQEHPTPPPNQTQSSENTESMYTHTHGPMANLQQRLDRANAQLNQARRAREQAADELEITESEVQASRELVRSLEREQRTAENYVRIFGTREEMERAGAEYESPIGGMFTRAWNRYQVAEEVRRETHNLRQVLEGEERVLEVEGPTQVQATESESTLNETNRNTLDESGLRDYYTTLRMQDGTQGALSDLRTVLESTQQSRSHSTRLRERMTQALQQHTSTDTRSSSFPRVAAQQAWSNRERRRFLPIPDSSDSEQDGLPRFERDEPRGLDRDDDGRPPPKSDKDMTVKLECKICYQQLADTVVLPCGHLVMCEWCAAQHVPSHQADRTRPKRPADCPLCRKRIRQKAKIFRS